MRLSRRNWLGVASSFVAVNAGRPLWSQEGTEKGSTENPQNNPTADDASDPVVMSDWQKSLWTFGVNITAGSSACTDVIATFAVPREWPEQKVKLVNQQISPYVAQQQTRDLNHLAKQYALAAPRIPANATLVVSFTFEIERAVMKASPAENTWRVPPKPDKDLKEFLTPSPYIDPRHGKIRKAVAEIMQELTTESASEVSDETTAQEGTFSPKTNGSPEVATVDGWKLAEKIYDWTRAHVAYRESDIKTAIKALEDGNGDCEELTSVFVAICRCAKIPSRMVWVPGHCYPEFYLEKADGKGAWFPCQIAGTRMFGAMQEDRPIMQKGERFKVPEHKDIQRYITEYCTARGTRKPDVSFISQKAT